MRRLMSAGLAGLLALFATAPAQAQQGEPFMWCVAWADNGFEKTYFYSGFFSAGAWEAERKALKFKSAVEDEELSAAKVTATCMAPADYDKAVAGRNAAMKAGPGKVLNWEG